MNFYYRVLSEIMRELWPPVPYTHPRWLAGVQTSLPAAVMARAAGHSARVLTVETIAAEQFRATRAFAGV